MWLVPSRQQFRRWSMPNKVGYVGFVLGVLGLILTIGLFAFDRATSFSPEPSISLFFRTKPYLRLETGSDGAIVLSYEVGFRNMDSHAVARQLRYSRLIQTLQINGRDVVTVPAEPKFPPPNRLNPREEFFQIFKLTNRTLAAETVSSLMARLDSGELAIVLDIETQFTDAGTSRQLSNAERLRIYPSRVEILQQR
jgi:hypothetical protein